MGLLYRNIPKRSLVFRVEVGSALLKSVIWLFSCLIHVLYHPCCWKRILRMEISSEDEGGMIAGFRFGTVWDWNGDGVSVCPRRVASERIRPAVPCVAGRDALVASVHTDRRLPICVDPCRAKPVSVTSVVKTPYPASGRLTRSARRHGDTERGFEVGLRPASSSSPSTPGGGNAPTATARRAMYPRRPRRVASERTHPRRGTPSSILSTSVPPYLLLLRVNRPEANPPPITAHGDASAVVYKSFVRHAPGHSIDIVLKQPYSSHTLR